MELCRAAVAACANAKEYAQSVEALDAAIDAGGADEKHPLARLVDYLGDLVAEYEAKDRMPSVRVVFNYRNRGLIKASE